MRSVLIFVFLVSSLWGQDIKAHKCGFSDVGTTLNRASSPQDRYPDLDEFIISPSGNFKIHFTRAGYHAVMGSGESGTPEFVTEAGLAADSAYTLLVDELGFMAPLPDGDVDGPELDIYINNFGGSYYALTYYSGYYPNFSGIPTYMVIDNDFSESNYTTHGIEALKVTIAHEFFHMVQLRYAHPSDPAASNVFWYEISSVWFEELCYPDINDYLTYVESNFQAAQFPALDNTNYMYGHGIFGQVLDQQYGKIWKVLERLKISGTF